jgi:hypothetical protein
MDFEDSLRSSPKPANHLCPMPDELSPRKHILFLEDISKARLSFQRVFSASRFVTTIENSKLVGKVLTLIVFYDINSYYNNQLL